jgi:hypothetical protein
MKPISVSLVVTAAAFTSVNTMSPQTPEASLIPRVDHLVYATPDLARGVAEVEKLLGIKATPGGQHPGRGTRNALISLGPTAYLEIIGPDPEQPAPAEPRVFGIDELESSRLVTWAANATKLHDLHKQAADHGITLGSVGSGSRKRPDGGILSWNFTNPLMVDGGIMPFFLEWTSSPHPATTSAKGATLLELRAEHPEPARVQEQLRKLGLHMQVTRADVPALIAVIATQHGRVELR